MQRCPTVPDGDKRQNRRNAQFLAQINIFFYLNKDKDNRQKIYLDDHKII